MLIYTLRHTQTSIHRFQTVQLKFKICSFWQDLYSSWHLQVLLIHSHSSARVLNILQATWIWILSPHQSQQARKRKGSLCISPLLRAKALRMTMACRLPPLWAESFAGSSFLTENVVLGGVRSWRLLPSCLSQAFSTPAPLMAVIGWWANAPKLSSHLFSKWRLCSSINTANVIELSFPWITLLADFQLLGHHLPLQGLLPEWYFICLNILSTHWCPHPPHAPDWGYFLFILFFFFFLPKPPSM